MDQKLYDEILLYKEAIAKNHDVMLVIDGVEGSGKSTLAQQIAYAYDQNVSLKNIVFTADQFKQAATELPEGSVIIWDEAIFGGYSANGTSKINKVITQLMTTIRKRRLFFIVVIPHFKMLSEYLAVDRSRALIRVRLKGLERGPYSLYISSTKRRIYEIEKKRLTMTYPSPFFSSEFWDSSGKIINEEEYDKKKTQAINTLTEEEANEESKWKLRTLKLLSLCLSLGAIQRQIADELEVSQSTIRDWKHEASRSSTQI